MLRTVTLLTFLLSFQAHSLDLTKSFHSVKKNSPSSLSMNEEMIIHETADHFILKTPLTNFSSYDYYAVQVPNKKTLEWLRKNSHVTFERGEHFAILQMNNEKQVQAAAAKLHREGHFCGMMQKLSATPINTTVTTPQPLILKKDNQIASVVSQINENNIVETIKIMSSWKSRYHQDSQGIDTGEKLIELYKKVLPEDRSDVEFELVDHSGSPQKSIIVRIPGKTNPSEILILGSHIDSINSRNNADAPGADDNASGTATNLEVFRVLMKNGMRPDKTIEIHGYAAEEIGLVGSAEIAEDYRKKNKNVIAMVQFDMNGYTKSNAKVTFVSNGTNSTLNNQLSSLVDDYLQVPSSSGYLLFGTSDHASWKKRGFPVSFPTEDPFAYNHKIHSKDDTLGYINSPEQIREFGKLGVAYLMHFAGY